jgi:hypothetical protein
MDAGFVFPSGFWSLANIEHFRPVTCRAELNVGQRPIIGHELKKQDVLAQKHSLSHFDLSLLEASLYP